MAVIVTAASGFDVGYLLGGVGKEPERTAGGYYLNAAQSGEAPGRWFGRGAESLGLTGEVREDDYRTLYGERPADPRTGEPLGAPRRSFSASYETRRAELLAAEPQATTERVRELEAMARKDTRTSPLYTDLTVSFSKSISILHGSIRENARLAREAGDLDEAAVWDDREARFSECLQAANRAALRHVEEWAAVTRTGYHGSRPAGEEAGKWEPAELIISSWLQGSSRDGDMQDHVHNPVHPRVRTLSDGKWRAVDTMALRAQLPAMAAVASTYIEAALTREFGVEWVPRADGKGNEIRGISQAQIDEFSSRRAAISARTRELAREFAEKYGRAPNQRELSAIDNAAWAETRAAKDEAPFLRGEGKDARIDWDAAAQFWDARAGGDLARVTRDVTCARGADELARGAHQLRADEMARAARTALARVSAAHPSFTRAQLMREVAAALPAHARGADPEASVALVDEVTDRALAGAYEEVVSMAEPTWPALPDSMVRGIDGQSWYTRPGAVRYATRVQLSLEERLVARAQRETTARMTREDAARELGADVDALDRALRERAQAGRAAETTGSGLRMDQAAALAYLLTSRRVAEVLVGPAGSGKTRTLATGARAWTNATGAKVIGLATAQAARNVLADAGVDLAENLSQFLGHLPGQRGARGARDLEPGTLIVMDESSMVSTADMADVIEYAANRGCKVIAAGDQEQLASVEGGGGMHLLASKLGYVQLAEAVRFEEDWERKASLGLRHGSKEAITAYDMQGRLFSAEPEQALDEAATWYTSWMYEGSDTLLIAMAHETCRELSRRVRDELASTGRIDTRREVPIAYGARAGVGDIIIARKNDHSLHAGEPGRPLANGDILKVLEVNDDGSLTVQRKVGRDPDTGEAQWSAGTFRHTDLANTDLGYAVTGHSAQGLTVTKGIALVTGSETRQWLYTSMTRGARLNQAVVFSRPAKPADTAAGTRAAPELARADRMQREREGLPPLPESSPGKPEARGAHAVLSDISERGEAEESALETWERMLADADHLGRLAAMWDDLTGDARRESYRAAVRAALPPGYEDTDLDGGHATWLWRTLRHAEAAGMDVGRLVATAIAERPLTGARDVAAVLDARLRAKVDPAAPLAPKPWAERVPEVGDPERQEFLRQLAAAMDGRQERLGAHAAVARPAWALSALGPVPDDPTDRLEWEHRAAAIAAYRERFAWEDETEPVGPEPVNSPEARAMWFAAHAAMTRTDEAGLDRLPEGSLWHMRSTYEAETAWAPAYAADELRQVRMAAMRARAQVEQAENRAAAAREAGDAEVAARHDVIAASARDAQTFYEARAELDAGLVADRNEWAERTAGSRLLAVQADAELRRRNPDLDLEPLRSAEPEPVPDVVPEITGPDAAAAHAEAVARQREVFRERLEERLGLMVPSEDPDAEPEGEAWPAWLPADREAVIQPPPPQMPPAPQIQRQAEQDREMEAAL